MASLVPRRKNREQAINEKCLATSSSLVGTNTKGFLTEHKVCTVKYRTEVFSTDQASAASEFCIKKAEVRYLTVQTEQARSVNCLLYD